jgi:hypothetical protein
MAGPTTSRARLRDLACLGRSRPPEPGDAGLRRTYASPRRAGPDAASIAAVPSVRPRAARTRPETSDLVEPTI